jgi:expansin (peptidoglycan-binding protein)
MTTFRNVLVLVGLLVLIGVEFRMKTAVASPNALEPVAYLPLITKSGTGVIGPVHQGNATYYNATGAGNCLFPATPDDLMVAAINHTEYGVADYCGAYVRVTGRKGSVIVRIVDKCPDAGCIVGHLDLSREAFAVIDDIPLGFVPITWQVVSPEMNGPIRFEFKEKNQWWTAVQVRNHRNPIAKFEYRPTIGSVPFKQVARTDYNYFLEASGMGEGPYTFRVTDILGNVIVSSNIPLSNPGVEINGSGQFPPP